MEEENRESKDTLKKNRGPAGYQTQDLLIASQMLLPLSYWSSWAEEK